MRAIHRIMATGVLFALILVGLSAVACGAKYSVEIMAHDLGEVDLFLAEFDNTPYNFGESWKFGIVTRKEWFANSSGTTQSAHLKVRGQDGKTWEVVAPEDPESYELINKTRTGDLIAFTGDLIALTKDETNTDELSTMKYPTVRVLVKNKETKFTQKFRRNVALD